MKWPRRRECRHKHTARLCITCGNPPGVDIFGRRTHPRCICQDFRDNVCTRCFTLIPPTRSPQP